MAPQPPRIPPLPQDEWTAETHAALVRWQPPMNFHRTMAHNPRTLAAWIGFGEHILFDNLLPFRERELVILRIAANLDCAYEWGAHRRYALAEQAMTPEEADRLARDLDPSHWTSREGALIGSVDDLQRTGAIGDAAWSALAANGFTAAHFMDLIYLAGEFIMVAMFMKSFRIALEDGFSPIPRG